MNRACVALALYGSTDVDIEELPFLEVVPDLERYVNSRTDVSEFTWLSSIVR